MYWHFICSRHISYLLQYCLLLRFQPSSIYCEKKKSNKYLLRTDLRIKHFFLDLKLTLIIKFIQLHYTVKLNYNNCSKTCK